MTKPPEPIATLQDAMDRFREAYDTEPEILLVPFALRDEYVSWSIAERRFVSTVEVAGKKGVQYGNTALIGTNKVTRPTPAKVEIVIV